MYKWLHLVNWQRKCSIHEPTKFPVTMCETADICNVIENDAQSTLASLYKRFRTISVKWGKFLSWPETNWKINFLESLASFFSQSTYNYCAPYMLFFVCCFNFISKAIENFEMSRGFQCGHMYCLLGICCYHLPMWNQVIKRQQIKGFKRNSDAMQYHTSSGFAFSFKPWNSIS